MNTIPANHDEHSPYGCPVMRDRRLPADGLPLRPAPALKEWRNEASLTPLVYADGHVGMIATRYHAAQSVLSDARFVRQPTDRFPLPSPRDEHHLDAREPTALRAGDILNQDGDRHARLRRSITARFSVKSARAMRGKISAIVTGQLDALMTQPRPVDLTTAYAEAIAGRTHSLVLGIPESHYAEYLRLFVEGSTSRQRHEFVREVLAIKRDLPGEDTLTDLLNSDLELAEIEGLTSALMSSGRDSVAYMIATTTVALLTHPQQLDTLKQDPALIDGAVEEFMRVGAMFVTLFPRTATEDLEVDGVQIKAGTSVSVSPVAVNHDPSRFDEPDVFDVTRDAFGHLGFGFGIHGCVGQQVARVEIKEAITQLIARVPNLRLVHADQAEPTPFAHQVGTYQAGHVLVDWN